MSRFLALALLALLAGCAHSRVTIPVLSEPIILAISPHPWCGRCDSYTITLANDGRAWLEHGWWAGDYSDWRTRVERAQLPPERISEFSERLNLLRPEGQVILDSTPFCDVLITDAGYYRIEWPGESGVDRLILDRGCQGENADRLEASLGEIFAAFGVEVDHPIRFPTPTP